MSYSHYKVRRDKKTSSVCHNSALNGVVSKSDGSYCVMWKFLQFLWIDILDCSGQSASLVNVNILGVSAASLRTIA